MFRFLNQMTRATGETCGAAKYCESGKLDASGRCAPEKIDLK
jgi:hypothetical protein